MSETTTSREQHELSFEEFDVRVSIEATGDIWVSFHESGRCAFTISFSDLADAMRFAAKHGGIDE